MIEWAPEDLTESKIRENVCRELEALCSVEMVICLRQVGLQLYSGLVQGGTVYIPIKSSSIYTQSLESRKNYIINEPARERQAVNEVRTTLGITSKLNNMMIVPLGRN